MPSPWRVLRATPYTKIRLLQTQVEPVIHPSHIGVDACPDRAWTKGVRPSAVVDLTLVLNVATVLRRSDDS